MTPLSAISLLLISGPKNGLKRPKSWYFCSIVALLTLQKVFAMLLDQRDALHMRFCLFGWL